MNDRPNFKEMSKKELRDYVLSHRDDEEAFHAYMDKLHAQENRVKYPPLKSMDDLENYPDFIEILRQDPGRKA